HRPPPPAAVTTQTQSCLPGSQTHTPNVTADGCVKLLVLPAIHKDTLRVLHALITALGRGLVQYSSVLQRLFSQTLSAWTTLPETSLGQQRAFSAVRVSLYHTLELWVRVGGASASVLQGSPTHSELLLAHLLGDNTPLADSVRPTSSPQLRDLVSKKPCSKSWKPGLAVSDSGSASPFLWRLAGQSGHLPVCTQSIETSHTDQ
uniref:PELP1 middle domain-containing protein n=1 Tax=Oncorhynchus tshawytscha TaxID=74940 RepID=A0AAZ3QA38_ONCTS